MKVIAVVAGIACVFLGTSFSSAASLGSQPHRSTTSWPHAYTSIMLPAIGPFEARRAFLPQRVFLPQEAADTATPTATVSPTPSPTPNPAYPDPVPLLAGALGQASGLSTGKVNTEAPVAVLFFHTFLVDFPFL